MDPGSEGGKKLFDQGEHVSICLRKRESTGKGRARSSGSDNLCCIPTREYTAARFFHCPARYSTTRQNRLRSKRASAAGPTPAPWRISALCILWKRTRNRCPIQKRRAC